MTQYVLYHRGTQPSTDDVKAIEQVKGLKVLQRRDSRLMLVEMEGDAQELFTLVANMEGWVASEQRTYRLA
jgi:hypothetical protein